MRRSILWLTALVGVTSGVAAQTSPPSSTSHLIPQYSAEVIVTATLDEEPESEISASATVISTQEIADRQVSEVLDLLRTVPGLAVVRSGSPGKVTSLFSRGTNSNQTLFLWNGLEINDPFLGAVDLSGLSAHGVERIEAVKGPFSALYGGSAVGGVVQVLSAQHQGGGVRLEGGGDGYRRGAFTGGLDVGTVHLELSAQSRQGDGQVDNDFFDSDDLAARAEWQARPDLMVGLGLSGTDSEVGVPFGFFGDPTPNQTNARERRQIQLPVSWTSSDWSVDGRLGRYSEDLVARNPDNPFSGSETEATSSSARAVARRQSDDRSWWIAFGGDWEEQEAEREDAFSVLPTVDQGTWAAFSQLRLQRGPVTLDAGLRYDDADTFGSETNLRLGSVVALGDGWRLRGSYGEGFRPPSLSDLYFPGFSNPDLEAERAESYELGIDGERGAWRWGLVAFNIDQENLIQFAPPTFLPFNVGRARSQGLEGQATVRLDRFVGRLTATYLEAEDRDTDSPLLRRPEESADLLLTWRFGDWTLNAVGQFVGERFDFGGVELDSYTTLDLATTWVVRSWASPFLRIENVTDESYEEAAGFPAPDRTVSGGVSLSF
ncbi:MAG: TonB-dependent receptor [Acidobacteriota bacterium]